MRRFGLEGLNEQILLAWILKACKEDGFGTFKSFFISSVTNERHHITTFLHYRLSFDSNGNSRKSANIAMFYHLMLGQSQPLQKPFTRNYFRMRRPYQITLDHATKNRPYSLDALHYGSSFEYFRSVRLYLFGLFQICLLPDLTIRHVLVRKSENLEVSTLQITPFTQQKCNDDKTTNP